MPEAQHTVTVVGGGVAGLAAGSALAQAGYQVQLLERRPYLGGRASSYPHPALGETVDCQHVLVGCCTNLFQMLEQAGVADQVRWYDELTFLEPGGRASIFRPAALPAPLHYTASFLRAPMLTLADKIGIARGMTTLLGGIPADDQESLESWLDRTGQTERARRHFWEPVVICTLNDGFRNCSTRHAAHVFRELFMKSPVSGRLGIPTIPLSDLYSAVGRLIEERGGSIRLRSSVERIEPANGRRWRIAGADFETISDAVILALPFEQIQKLLPSLPQSAEAEQLRADLGRFVHSSYTTVHLWFDREITPLHHAALLDSDLQWIFHKSRIRSYPASEGSYVELVIAGSPTYLAMERQEILSRSLENLGLYFPEVRKARLVKSGILKEARATFSVLPGLDPYRRSPAGPWPGIFLAGDWAATGWPSTMESGVRSGYLAAEALAGSFGASESFSAPEIPASGLMRLFPG